MALAPHKTKIVATIGPASDSPEMLERLIRAGMNVARLNFSHGRFSEHADRIARLRAAERATGGHVTIMADLPGPKMRVGTISPEPVQLLPDATITLTTNQEVIGNANRVSISFEPLPRVVQPGDRLFLNDGLIKLVVERIDEAEVHCRVAVGGELRSRKGLNLPGIDLGICAFTEHDRACLEFALAHGVDAISQSFVERAADVEAVRAAARAVGKNPFIIAKIERSDALRQLDEILQAADGIMVARGDLGVEVPIEQIALIQKQLIALATAAGKPVITATQMLESMIVSRLPTRAEATDVANAILDGTDCIMLSGESAMGQFPEAAVAMLARIAARTEAHREAAPPPLVSPHGGQLGGASAVEKTLADVVQHAINIAPVSAVFVPTQSGTTARMISRFKPRIWVVALSPDPDVCQGLAFSYGVHPVLTPREPDNWRAFTESWLESHQPPVRLAVLVAGPSAQNPEASLRIEFLHVWNPAANSPEPAHESP